MKITVGSKEYVAPPIVFERAEEGEDVPPPMAVPTHIHQQDCFVPVAHEQHLISVGLFDGIAYFYRCLGREATVKKWKREKR